MIAAGCGGDDNTTHVLQGVCRKGVVSETVGNKKRKLVAQHVERQKGPGPDASERPRNSATQRPQAISSFFPHALCLRQRAGKALSSRRALAGPSRP